MPLMSNKMTVVGLSKIILMHLILISKARGDSRDFAEWFPKKIIDHSV